MRKFIMAVICTAAVGLAAAKVVTERQQVPTVYEAGHFYITVPVNATQSLRLLVDTGGGGGRGMFVLQSAAAKRVGLPARPCAQMDNSLRVVSLPPALEATLAPSIETPCHAAAVLVDGNLVSDHADGLIGASYMAGEIWTFDYPKRTLWREATAWRATDQAHVIAMDVARDEAGRVASLPAIELKIDGETFPVLLDTGATSKPTAAGAKASGELSAHGFGVTSYAPSSLINLWHAKHKDWPLVDEGDELVAHSRLIQVPHVEIAGWSVGPVWFTERSDKNIGSLDDFTDAPVKGVVGANIFRHFRMTLDYPKGVVEFVCVRGCQSSVVMKAVPPTQSNALATLPGGAG